MRPKDIQHAGNPQKSIIPKSAMFLMSKEDQGSEEDADPTDGGQKASAGDPENTPPELTSAMQELIAKYGADAVKEACDTATDSDTDDSPLTDGGTSADDAAGSSTY